MSDQRAFVTPRSDGVVVAVAVRPKAPRCRVAGLSGERVRIEVSAAPEGGRATREALETLARTLGVPCSAVSLLSGERVRHKAFLVRGIGPDEVIARLTRWGG